MKAVLISINKPHHNGADYGADPVCWLQQTDS